MSQKKALYLCANLFPVISGDSIYSYGIIERLVNYYDLDLICYGNYDSKESDYFKEKISNKIKNIQIVENPKSRITTYTSSIIYGNEMQKNTEKFNSVLKHYILDNEYDVIFLDNLRLGYLIKLLRKHTSAKIILVEHNIEANNIEEEIKYEKNYSEKIKRKLRNISIRKFENKIINSVDRVWCISSKDKKYFDKIRNDHTTKVIKPYFEFKRVKDQEDLNSNNYNLIILGSMFWYPNVQGSIWFIENVFNKLIEIDSRYKLYLVGNMPDSKLLNLSSENIIVTGRVPSVDEYIKKSDIMIVPIFIGGGVKIKILEGIMKGIPVISTRESIEGYDFNIFNDGFCANTADEFLNAILKINENKCLKHKFINNAVKCIEKQRDIVNLIKDIDDIR